MISLSLSLLLNHNNVETVIKREQKEIYKITIILNQSLIILVNFGFANVHFFYGYLLNFLSLDERKIDLLPDVHLPFFRYSNFFVGEKYRAG